PVSITGVCRGLVGTCGAGRSSTMPAVTARQAATIPYRRRRATPGVTPPVCIGRDWATVTGNRPTGAERSNRDDHLAVMPLRIGLQQVANPVVVAAGLRRCAVGRIRLATLEHTRNPILARIGVGVVHRECAGTRIRVGGYFGDECFELALLAFLHAPARDRSVHLGSSIDVAGRRV